MTDPSVLKTLLGRATSAHQAGRFTEARETYRNLLLLSPDFPEAVHFFGLLEVQTGAAEQGLALLERSIRLAPSVAFFHSNLGEVYRRQNRWQQATDCFQQCIKLDPDFAAGHNNLGNVLKSRGDVAGAIAAFSKALTLDPSLAVAHSNLLMLMHYDPAVTTNDLHTEHLRWAQLHGSQTAGRGDFPGAAKKDRLRLGYLSPDLGQHPVGTFVEPILEHHDRDLFEVFCYSDLPQPDETSLRMRRSVDLWLDTAHVSDDQLGQRIRQDRLDILVDLAGHTAGNRLPLLSTRLAPLQVSYLGYPDTTGLNTMDFRITDAVLNPPGDEALHTEKLIRIDGHFACYRPPSPSPEVQPLPALRRGYVTFGCPARLEKINSLCAGCWARILHAVPKSRLLVMNAPFGDSEAISRVRHLLSRSGIDPRRVDFSPRKPFADYLAQHHEVDLILETWPANGHTTSCHAMWMGVPVITVAGDHCVARLGASLLTYLGYSQWIAANPEQYVQIVSDLAFDLPRLAELRMSLRSRMCRSPVLDGTGFTRGFERVLLEMYRNDRR